MIIKYYTLYKLLTKQEEMSPWEAVVAINDIRKMDATIKQALWKWLQNGIPPKLTINGVSLQELINPDEDEGEQMSPLRAFMMLDWIKREPLVAKHYLSVHRFHHPREALTKEQETMLKKRLAQLEEDLPEEQKTNIDNSEEHCMQGEDIVVEAATETNSNHGN